MECPQPPGAPTLSDELRRGVNPYNLTFGAVASLVLGFVLGALGQAGFLPVLLGNAWAQGGLAALRETRERR